MEEEMMTPSKHWRSSPFWRPMLFFVGFLMAFSEVIVRLIQGTGVIDAIWPHAVRSLDWTVWLRTSTEQTLTLFILISIGAFFLNKWKVSSPNQNAIDEGLMIATGVVSGLIAIHFVMDIFYLKGAFLMLPMLYAWLLLWLLLMVGGMPRLRTSALEGITPARVVHLMGVFVAAWMLMPGVPALVGFAPSPPDAPAIGYGSNPGPYETIRFSEPYDMPEDVAAIQGDREDDVVFSVHVTLPLLPDESPIETIPLGILLHGFGYPDLDAYTYWIDHLSAKGMAVALVQYPSDLRPAGYESFEAVDVNGTSDFLQHAYRDTAIRVAINHLETMIIGENRSQEMEDNLGNRTVDPTSLWVGGHSLGGAYTFITLDEVLPKGWGSHALVVALESPASRPMGDFMEPDLSNLPLNTMVQVAVTEDDMSVGSCPGVFHQQMFNALPSERNQLIEVHSDHYGFPRLIASHYLQANPAHDRLSDWGFYRRIDAQADFLVAHGRNDSFTADWAYQYMIEKETLTQMGQWSDGTPVLPLSVYHDALNTEDRFSACT
ncbi:MAG: hypothetical protein CMA10_02860 [Euryarchaeota archaeon]|nr:hypothetical protein [Euryarchaeota archaeon]